MMWLVDHIGLGRITTRVDKSYLIFNDFHELPIHQESEIIVPYSDTVELVRIIRDVVLANNLPVNYITEVHACDSPKRKTLDLNYPALQIILFSSSHL